MRTKYEELVSALQWLLDDMTDAGENKARDSDLEYDSVAAARETLEKAVKATRD